MERSPRRKQTWCSKHRCAYVQDVRARRTCKTAQLWRSVLFHFLYHGSHRIVRYGICSLYNVWRQRRVTSDNVGLVRFQLVLHMRSECFWFWTHSPELSSCHVWPLLVVIVRDECHIYVSCLHIIFTCYVYMSWLHVMFTCHYFVSCLRVMFTQYAYVTCLHDLFTA